jgi:hypothetical protein
MSNLNDIVAAQKVHAFYISKKDLAQIIDFFGCTAHHFLLILLEDLAEFH